MISDNLLGRYECVNSSNNKYWHVIYDASRRIYLAQWGKITASQPQGTKEYSEMEVLSKLREKNKKGYRKVPGYQTMSGANSIHFIMCDDEEEVA